MANSKLENKPELFIKLKRELQNIKAQQSRLRSGFAKYNLKNTRISAGFTALWTLAVQTAAKIAEPDETEEKKRQHSKAEAQWQQWWHLFADHIFKLQFVKPKQSDEKQNDEKLDEQNPPQQPLTPLGFRANVLGAVNLSDENERKKFWRHLNADPQFLKNYKKKYTLVPSETTPAFSKKMDEVLNTYCDEFAKECSGLQAIVREIDCPKDVKAQDHFIARDTIPLKGICQSGKGVFLEPNEIENINQRIIEQVKTQRYLARQYWKEFGPDTLRFNGLFSKDLDETKDTQNTEKKDAYLKAYLLAQVNLNDPKDRKRFYAYLSHNNFALLEDLNNHGGLYAYDDTSPYWSSLAHTIRRILGNQQFAEELFAEYGPLSRKIMRSDIYLAQCEFPAGPRGRWGLAEIIRPRRWYERNKFKAYDFHFGFVPAKWRKLNTDAEREAYIQKLVPRDLTGKQFYQVLFAQPGFEQQPVKDKLIEHLHKNRDLLRPPRFNGEQLFHLFTSDQTAGLVTTIGFISNFTLPDEKLDEDKSTNPLIHMIRYIEQTTATDGTLLLRHQQFLTAILTYLDRRPSNVFTNLQYRLYKFNEEKWPTHTQYLVEDNQQLRQWAYEYLIKENKDQHYATLIQYAKGPMPKFKENIAADLQQFLVKQSNPLTPDQKNFMNSVLQTDFVKDITSGKKLKTYFLVEVFKTKTLHNLWQNNIFRDDIINYYRTNDWHKQFLAKGDTSSTNREIALAIAMSLTPSNLFKLFNTICEVRMLVNSDEKLKNTIIEFIVPTEFKQPSKAQDEKTSTAPLVEEKMTGLTVEIETHATDIQRQIRYLFSEAKEDEIKQEAAFLNAILSRSYVKQCVPENPEVIIPASVIAHLSSATLINLWNNHLYREAISKYFTADTWSKLELNTKATAEDKMLAQYIVKALPVEQLNDYFAYLLNVHPECQKIHVAAYATSIAHWLTQCLIDDSQPGKNNLHTLKLLVNEESLNISTIHNAFRDRIKTLDQDSSKEKAKKIELLKTLIMGLNDKIVILKKFPEIASILDAYEKTLRSIIAQQQRSAGSPQSKDEKTKKPKLDSETQALAAIQSAKFAELPTVTAMLKAPLEPSTQSNYQNIISMLMTDPVNAKECLHRELFSNEEALTLLFQHTENVALFKAFVRAVEAYPEKSDNTTTQNCFTAASSNLKTFVAKLHERVFTQDEKNAPVRKSIHNALEVLIKESPIHADRLLACFLELYSDKAIQSLYTQADSLTKTAMLKSSKLSEHLGLQPETILFDGAEHIDNLTTLRNFPDNPKNTTPILREVIRLAYRLPSEAKENDLKAFGVTTINFTDICRNADSLNDLKPKTDAKAVLASEEKGNAKRIEAVEKFREQVFTSRLKDLSTTTSWTLWTSDRDKKETELKADIAKVIDKSTVKDKLEEADTSYCKLIQDITIVDTEITEIQLLLGYEDALENIWAKQHRAVVSWDKFVPIRDHQRALYCQLRLVSLLQRLDTQLAQGLLTEAIKLVSDYPCSGETNKLAYDTSIKGKKFQGSLPGPLVIIVKNIVKNRQKASAIDKQMALDILRCPGLCRHLIRKEIMELASLSADHAKAVLLYDHLHQQELQPASNKSEVGKVKVRKLTPKDWEMVLSTALPDLKPKEIFARYGKSGFLLPILVNLLQYNEFLSSPSSTLPNSPVISSATPSQPAIITLINDKKLSPSTSQSPPTPDSPKVTVTPIISLTPPAAVLSVAAKVKNEENSQPPAISPISLLLANVSRIDDLALAIEQPRPPAAEEDIPVPPPMDSPGAPPPTDIADAPPLPDTDIPEAPPPDATPSIKQEEQINQKEKKEQKSSPIASNPHEDIFAELLSKTKNRREPTSTSTIKDGIAVDSKVKPTPINYELGLVLATTDDVQEKLKALKPFKIDRKLLKKQGGYLVVNDLATQTPKFILVYCDEKYKRQEYEIKGITAENTHTDNLFMSKHPALTTVTEVDKQNMIKAALKMARTFLMTEVCKSVEAEQELIFKRYEPLKLVITPVKKSENAKKSAVPTVIPAGKDLQSVLSVALSKYRKITQNEDDDDASNQRGEAGDEDEWDEKTPTTVTQPTKALDTPPVTTTGVTTTVKNQAKDEQKKNLEESEQKAKSKQQSTEKDVVSALKSKIQTAQQQTQTPGKAGSPPSSSQVNTSTVFGAHLKSSHTPAAVRSSTPPSNDTSGGELQAKLAARKQKMQQQSTTYAPS